MQGKHIILHVEGKGYVLPGAKLSYQFTSDPSEARAFPIRTHWHEEKELNQVKTDMEGSKLSFREEVFEWQTYRR